MATGEKRRFPIRFDGVSRLMSKALMCSPSESYVEVDDDGVNVRMAWTFKAKFARSAVKGATATDKRPLSRGVHGWAGRWLVNGASDGILKIDLEPTQRAYVMGWPVRLRELMVSVDEPEALSAALARSPSEKA